MWTILTHMTSTHLLLALINSSSTLLFNAIVCCNTKHVLNQYLLSITRQLTSSDHVAFVGWLFGHPSFSSIWNPQRKVGRTFERSDLWAPLPCDAVIADFLPRTFGVLLKCEQPNGRQETTENAGGLGWTRRWELLLAEFYTENGQFWWSMTDCHCELVKRTSHSPNCGYNGVLTAIFHSIRIRFTFGWSVTGALLFLANRIKPETFE